MGSEHGTVHQCGTAAERFAMIEVFKEVRNGTRTVVAIGQPGPGNAYHTYEVSHTDEGSDAFRSLGAVYFQNGPIKEAGVNGIHNEDLLAIVAHRLECFQTSTFACQENADALAAVQEARRILASRTSRRVAAGTEGTHNGT